MGWFGKKKQTEGTEEEPKKKGRLHGDPLIEVFE